MKEFYLFFVCFFVITFVGSIGYHGDRRFYTTVIDGKTYIALHVLKEPIKFIFPKDKTFVDLASEVQLYSPTENGKCEYTTNTLNFTLKINDQNHIRGLTLTEIEIVNNVISVTTFLYERCGGDERRFPYVDKTIDINPENLEFDRRRCFKDTVPFQVYDKDSTKHVMDLQVNGTINCQVFMILPSYMEVEDLKLNDTGKLKLNETFVGHDEKFWWKTENKNDEMLPNGITFDENKNVKINLLNSTVMIPYFFRIGINQPVPSIKFEFGQKCNGAKFGFFVNLRDKIDCKY
uniref:Uncharacterized protein n=1 Tax=Panagrolaimus sp. ES5 TaxID=591445 RepID=A0AC34FHM8_9BILA